MLKDVWAGIGDSIVVVGGDGLWNRHIHTDDIGAAIEAAVDAGRPRQIRVTDLMEQVVEERWSGGHRVRPRRGPPARHRGGAHPRWWRRPATASSALLQPGRAGHRGRWLSMNPSTADLLAAVEAVPSEQVVIPPNNKNIIPVAEQVDAHSDKVVRVVGTRGIAEGFAACPWATTPRRRPTRTRRRWLRCRPTWWPAR